MLSYHLLKAMKRTRATVGPVLAEHGLHPGQDLLLSQLWHEDGLTQTELANRLRIEAPTVTKAVQRLERAGFLRREPAGGRKRRIVLTAAGRALQGPVERAWQAADLEVTSVLDDADRVALGEILRRLTAANLAG